MVVESLVKTVRSWSANIKITVVITAEGSVSGVKKSSSNTYIPDSAAKIPAIQDSISILRFFQSRYDVVVLRPWRLDEFL